MSIPGGSTSRAWSSVSYGDIEPPEPDAGAAFESGHPSAPRANMGVGPAYRIHEKADARRQDHGGQADRPVTVTITSAATTRRFARPGRKVLHSTAYKLPRDGAKARRRGERDAIHACFQRHPPLLLSIRV